MSDNAVEYTNHIPEAVRRAGQLADELHAQQNGTAPSSDEPAVDPVVVETPPVVTPPVVTTPQAEDWEQRFRTLQGKYDAETAQFRSQLQSMQHLVAEMQSQPAPAPATPSRKTTTTVVVPQEDKDTFGEDLVNAVPLWARAGLQADFDEIRSELAEVRAENERLRGGQQRIETTSIQSRNEAGFDADPEIGGTWRQMNHDPEFLTWLAQVDPFAGVPRQGLLNDAAGRGDTARCIRFFKTYLTEHTAVSQPSPVPTVQTPPTPGVADVRPTLESLAAPGRSSSGSPGGSGGASAEKRVWMKPQILAFYRDCSQGKYAHREAERQSIERDIFDAMPEGRIRN